MSSSALYNSVLQGKISNIQNAADSSGVYSAGQWSFKNSTAVTSVTITDAGNVGVGATTTSAKLTIKNPNVSGEQQILDIQNAASTGQIASLSFNQTDDMLKLSVKSGTGYLAFGTGATGTERMRIDASGNLLVGTTVSNPIVSGVNGVKVFASLGILQANASSNAAFEVGRYVTTGTMTAFYYGGISVGNISTNGSTITFSGNALSDERWKENLNPINDALSSVKQIQFIEFDYKENKQKSAGVTAQQLQTIPELSKFVIDGSDEESYKAVDYNALIGYLGKAIQELSAKVDAQAAEIEALKAK